MTKAPDTLLSNQGPPTLDPYATEMIEILAVNLSWHLHTQVHPSQHQLAWDHFCAVVQGSRRASPVAYAQAMSDKPRCDIGTSSADVLAPKGILQ